MTVLPLLGVVACADVWGFSDLTEAPDAVARDATTAEEAAVGGAEGGTDSGPDGSLEEDGPSGELPDAREEREVGEADVGIREGGARDGGDDGAAATKCKPMCPMGCCDSQGICHTGNTTASCGTNGNACEACSGTGCTALTSACCTSKQACGCMLTVILCN